MSLNQRISLLPKTLRLMMTPSLCKMIPSTMTIWEITAAFHGQGGLMATARQNLRLLCKLITFRRIRNCQQFESPVKRVLSPFLSCARGEQALQECHVVSSACHSVQIAQY